MILTSHQFITMWFMLPMNLQFQTLLMPLSVWGFYSVRIKSLFLPFQIFLIILLVLVSIFFLICPTPSRSTIYTSKSELAKNREWMFPLWIRFEANTSFGGNWGESVRFLSILSCTERKGEFWCSAFKTWTSNIVEWMLSLWVRFWVQYSPLLQYEILSLYGIRINTTVGIWIPAVLINTTLFLV